MPPRFPTSWLDELYARADIVQVVSDYLPLKKDGRRYWGLCPFHNEKTASFSVNPELNLYYCFGCKAGGNVIQFLMEMEHLSFYEAAKLLADRMHMPLPQMVEDPDYERKRSQRERLLEANRLAARYYHEMLWTEKGRSAREYFYRRGLDDGIIRRFGLGVSLADWSDLTEMLLQKGFSLEELRLAGLTVVKGESHFDFFRGRAMFPILDQQGNVLAFGGRIMGEGQPKYLNTGDTPVFNKRLGVYAVNLLKKTRGLNRVLLVEGYMDVVSLSQAGVVGVVATLGTALTQEQARLLKRFAPEIWVAYDGDSAGQHAIERALAIFEEEQIKARVLYFPDNLDPDEFIRQRGIEAFDLLQPLSAVKYRLMRLEEESDLSDQEARIEFAKKGAALLAGVRDPVELEAYLRDLAVKTGFEREVLVAQMGISVPAAERSSPPFKKNGGFQKAAQSSEGMRSEQLLVSLLASGALPEGMVREEDLVDETLRAFVRRLNAGEKPAAILASAETPMEREQASRVFTMQAGEEPENAVVIAADCLKNLRLTRLQNELNRQTASMAAVSDPEQKRHTLTEIMRLNTEMKRLREQNRQSGTGRSGDIERQN